MRSVAFAVLLGSSVFAPAFAQTSEPSGSPPAAQSQSAPADLCKELLAYAEKKAAEPPKDQAQAPAPAAAPPPRADGAQTGTQGAGSVGPSSSKDTSTQAAAPPTIPVAPGAAPEAASSPHATDDQANSASAAGAADPQAAFKLAGGITVAQVRDTAAGGDRQACRDMTQTIRRGGGDLPAALIALAAYEPDPAKRK